jgi:ribosomal protein L10
MLKNGEIVNEMDSLLQNMQHYIPNERDLLRLSKEESDNIYMSRQKPKVDLIRRAMKQSGIESSICNSDKTEYILDQMLDGHTLSSFSLGKSVKPAHLAPMKSQNDKVSISSSASSDSSSDSSTSSESTLSHKCQCHVELKEEITFLRGEVQTMGLALGNLIEELKGLTERLNAKENNENVKSAKNEKPSTSYINHHAQNKKKFHSYQPYYKKPSQQQYRRNYQQQYRKPHQDTISKPVNTHIRF